MNIFVAAINHREGSNLYAGVTQDDIDGQVYNYVKANWYEVHEPMPADPQTAVDRYFEIMVDNGEHVAVDQVELVGFEGVA